LVTLYTALAGSAGKSTSVPPWDDSLAIDGAGNSAMTWKNMTDLLDLSPYFQSRVSPGAMQTLISTANAVLKWVADVWTDIQGVFSPVGPSAANWWSYLGVPQIDLQGNQSDFLNDWLLQPRNSILVGAAHIRRSYNGIFGEYQSVGPKAPEQIYWDLPRLAGAYNAGSVQNPPQPSTDATRTWGIRYSNDYMSMCGSVYNGMIDYLGSHPAIIPPVRLLR